MRVRIRAVKRTAGCCEGRGVELVSQLQAAIAIAMTIHSERSTVVASAHCGPSAEASLSASREARARVVSRPFAAACARERELRSRGGDLEYLRARLRCAQHLRDRSRGVGVEHRLVSIAATPTHTRIVARSARPSPPRIPAPLPLQRWCSRLSRARRSSSSDAPSTSARPAALATGFIIRSLS